MFKLDPLQWAKLIGIMALMAYGWYIFDSRADYKADADALRVQVGVYEAQAKERAQQAAGKAAAYAEAKRKADIDAKELRSRVAWLQKQTGKGCADAARIIQEYRRRS